MAASYETMTDEAVGILEKAIKTKPKDTKARIALHKKSNAKVEELQAHMVDRVAKFAKLLDEATRTLEEAMGVASNEARLLDREVVRHLRRAIKLSKSIDKPNKAWTENFDKAVKAVAEWDPKAESVDALEKGIKFLQAGKKSIQTNYEAYRKQQVECNALVDKALEDLDEVKDAHLKEVLAPYTQRYLGFFQ